MHEYENEMHVMDVLFRIMYRKKEIMYRKDMYDINVSATYIVNSHNFTRTIKNPS